MIPASRLSSSGPALARVCITGGAGMIGRRLASRLARRGVEVAIFDDLRGGFAMPDTASVARSGDIRDEAALDALLLAVRPDALVHLAALHHVPTCEAERALCLDINVSGTERVLAAAARAGIGQVVLASSGAVYAWTPGALSEDVSPTDPQNNYALSKLCNEHQLRFWCERTGGRGRVARIFNTIAADDCNAHLIPDILGQIRGTPDGTTVVRLGNLASRRDYLHADEVADGLVALLADDRPVAFDIFNLASGEEHSVEAIVGGLAACLGRSVRIEVDEARCRTGDRPSQLGDPGKARELLDWRCRMTLPQVLHRIVAEWRDAPPRP